MEYIQLPNLEEEPMQATVQEYTQRLLSYSEGKDPLRSQQAAPIKLAALLRGKTRKQLTRRPAPARLTARADHSQLAAPLWRLASLAPRQ